MRLERHRGHRPAEVIAEDRGPPHRRRRAPTRPGLGVDGVDSGRGHLDEHLGIDQQRHRRLADREHLGRSGLVDDEGAHRAGNDGCGHVPKLPHRGLGGGEGAAMYHRDGSMYHNISNKRQNGWDGKMPQGKNDSEARAPYWRGRPGRGSRCRPARSSGTVARRSRNEFQRAAPTPAECARRRPRTAATRSGAGRSAGSIATACSWS